MGIMSFLRQSFYEQIPPPDNFNGEVARQLDDIYRQWMYALRKYNPDLLAAKKGGLKIYKDMREDDQVKACLQLKKSAVITPGWDIEGGNEEQVDFLNFVFDQMEGTMDGFIVSLLSAFDYGFSLHEKVFNYVDQGTYKGKIGLKALRPKSPTRIDFDTDDFGNLKPDGITQRQNSGTYLRLPVDKFILYTYQKEFDNLYGESDLKSAYRPWFVKTNVLRYWAIYLERFSIPIVKGKTTSGRVTDAQRNDYKKLMTAIQAGMSILLPNDMTMDLLESSRTDRGVFNQAIDAFNVAIARSILIPQLMGLVPQAGVGSYGKSETDLKVFDWVLGAIGKEIQDVINEQLVCQLIDINYGTQESYPKFEIKPLKQEDKTRIAAAWGEAVARGAATSTIETQKWIREMLDAPEITPDEEKQIDKETELLLNPPQPAGASGLAGKNPSGGKNKMANSPGKANQYAHLSGPEGRIDWDLYEKAFDEIEWASKDELSKTFAENIYALIKDAKKKP